jgi:hypothetical protein
MNNSSEKKNINLIDSYKYKPPLTKNNERVFYSQQRDTKKNNPREMLEKLRAMPKLARLMRS